MASRVGDGPQGHRLFHPALPHDLQRLGDAGGVVGLQVDGQQVGPRLGEVLDVPHRLVDHQVDVQKHVGALADRLDHRDADGEVGHKGAVHHIHMEVVGGGHPLDVPLQIDEIGGQNRRSDFNHGMSLAFQKNVGKQETYKKGRKGCRGKQAQPNPRAHRILQRRRGAGAAPRGPGGERSAPGRTHGRTPPACPR